ncbi:MAG: hypothetical protein KF824_11995 [Fimbriimonadaceae bacterium]|nr:MAG: hypothetical protein KF824_11995 [Fimbriimonadaceae bacterium]
MKWLALFMAFAVFGTSMAEAPTPQLMKEDPVATRINLKIRRVEILDQLLPVLMTKEQIKKLLPIVEKARQMEVDLQKKELGMLKDLEPLVDKELENGIKKQMLTSAEFNAEYAKIVAKFHTGRAGLIGMSTGMVYEEMKKVLNDGQRTAAAKAVPAVHFPGRELNSVSQEEKLKVWIREVMLDRASYELLSDMAR